ncbi:trifunctional dihydropteroate synthetase [Rhizophlyctis rosea]|nr:trifunctional dihydropteroate synthetase [Rhizophlyctis rosea]
MDKIIVRDLEVRNIIGVDAWERSKRQPLNINITIYSDIDASGEKDLLSESINYGTVAKTVQEFSEKTSYRSVEALAQGIAEVCVRDCKAGRVTVRVEKGKALLHARCAGVEITRSREDIDLIDHIRKAGIGSTHPHPPARLDAIGEDQIFIKGLVLNTIIGVNAWEREERQRVVLDLLIHLQFDPTVLIEDHVPKMHNYRTITRTVSKYVEESNYKTVEAFALSIAKLMICSCHVPKVTVRVEKPSALVFAQGAGVEITRSRSDFGLEEAKEASAAPPATSTGLNKSVAPTTAPPSDHHISTQSALPHIAFLAFGSNLGDRAHNIEEALTRLGKAGTVRIDDTSFLYETAPMYKTDQPQFLNGVIKVATSLTPHELLAHLKSIEGAMGRDFNGERFGPRPIDLDILFYNHLELKSDDLIIPHPRIKEREFVLRPLCDLAPNMEHPGLFRTNAQLLALLSHATRDPEPGKTSTNPSPQNSPSIYRVTPIRDTLWRWNDHTLLMGILNVTPDSFSDGGEHFSVSKAVEHATDMVAQGVDVIDVGGMSTRPNADEIPEEEELRRVVPVIEALRAKGIKIPISVDTYRATVARKAVEAGADLVNDVTGGNGDANMVAEMAKLKVPVVLMHMRGTPKTMTQLTDYGGDVIGDIRRTLGSITSTARTSGIRRWNIILDPGIGFAKTVDQNFEILRDLHQIVRNHGECAGFPTLVGPSRKGFIGSVVREKDPKGEGRVWGTAACCSAAVAGGADILRVHDVREMRDVVGVADRCFRRR